MKKNLLLLVIFFIGALGVNAQSVAEYYNFYESSETFTSIVSTGTKVTPSGTDDGYYNLDLSSEGFTFPYAGTDYSLFSINTNGGIQLGTTNFSTWANNLTSSSYQPVIAPLWDDMKFFNYDTVNQGIFYQLDGTSGNRVLTIEWANLNRFGNGGDTCSVSFQVKLYEANGAIEIIYGDMSNAANWSSASASIGINKDDGGTMTFQSITPGNPTTVSTTDANNSVPADSIATITEGTTYHFTYEVPTAYTVTFSVKDTVDNPIEGVEINVHDTTLISDANGQATITLFNGNYTYSAFLDGYSLYNGSFSVSDADTTINVVLHEAVYHQVTFVVKSESGIFVENANISVFIRNITTDNNGEATVGLENNTYDFSVTKEGYQDFDSTLTVQDTDMIVNVVLHLDTSNCFHYSLYQDDIGVTPSTFGVDMADFNGDGWTDVVTIDAYKTIVMHFWDSTENKMDTTSIRLGQNRWRFDVEAVDIDNDGDMDFITSPMSSESYGMEVWENNGNGNFTLKTDQIATHTDGNSFAVGDLNGDGYADIFFPYNDIAIYLNDGNGNFVSNGQSGFSVSSAEDAALGDFDGDGDLDAVVVRSGGDGFVGKVFVNDGTGQFVNSGQELSHGNAEGVGVGDIDNDGDLDIIIAPWTGNIYFFMNDGLGTFMPGDTLAGDVFAAYNDIEVKDLNYDGLVDLATDHDVWINNPDTPGHFTQVQIFDESSHGMDIKDVDKDGFDDLYIGVFSSHSGDDLYLHTIPSFDNVYDTICQGDSILIGGVWRTEPGIYYEQINCVEILKYHLAFYDEFNTTITENNGTLTVAEEGATYQWLDCNNNNSPIDGATSQSFTPDTSGSYAVIVSNGTCSDTSDCYDFTMPSTGLDNLNNIKIYPNPVSDFINISGLQENATITLTDASGKVFIRKNANDNNIRIATETLPSGVYILKIQTDKEIIVRNIVKN